MGGLLVATVLTLLVVPSLYAIWFRVRANEPMPALTVEPALDAPDWATVPLRIAAE